MELRQLRSLKAVAETGSFTLAGKRVNLTQAAVSMHIKALEEELGAPVFKRANKRVFLTRLGQALLKHARAILKIHDDAKAEIAALTNAEQGTLRIGTASTMISTHPLPEILAEFKRQFPLVDVEVFGGTSNAIIQRICDNRLDLGLISLPVDHPDIQTESLYGDRLVAVAAPGHALARASAVKPAQLAAERLILGEKGGNTRRLIDLYFETHGLNPKIAMELNRADACKRMVQLGLGISILPYTAVRHELETMALRPLKVRALRLRWELGMAYSKSDSRSPAMRTFMRLCREHLSHGGSSTER